jgi:hypothetical protein
VVEKRPRRAVMRGRNGKKPATESILPVLLQENKGFSKTRVRCKKTGLTASVSQLYYPAAHQKVIAISRFTL